MLRCKISIGFLLLGITGLLPAIALQGQPGNHASSGKMPSKAKRTDHEGHGEDIHFENICYHHNKAAFDCALH